MKTLVIITHSEMSESKINSFLKDKIMGDTNFTVHDLYEQYPDERINKKAEQQLLIVHERIIFQFPNYWYSYPPLLKKWFDIVLERGWAFRGKHALAGKEFGIAVSSGFTPNDYRFDGLHRHTLDQVMSPFTAMCNFIQTKSLPMFTSFEGELIAEADYEKLGNDYMDYLRGTYSFHRDS
ncbi:NAD(P)H-dependent oxidoreductase [Aquibacillus salsiterrae]|uniref:NAD(P)H-dependent oxidoreductase n=1 Tax=Aquibacillus salsiterrae TaxID=2950439 RepID=A0A9X4AFH2_9BACI|nr:NAD(P)H-dependent oxidoreductase [Aquibacillus salsiterrae]MDC3418012.1 NAD(P)H-dependent oxidoreductase [Aquibacillus salsiterrae]